MFLKNSLKHIKKMGLRYSVFRISHEILRRSGLLRISYPVNCKKRLFVSLRQWRNEAKPFFISTGNGYNYNESTKKKLENESTRIFSGDIQFFTGAWYSLGKKYDWLTNPENGYRFDNTVHWTKVKDFNETQGDIKYVWEKARFTYLYSIIRNDRANETDSSRFIWDEIISWITSSQYNCGPHYKCSQEISIRVLNWIFALYFYKNSDELTENEFNDIVNAIYFQTKHVESNILFSKIAVRNNHAVTEALCLFTVGLLFPWFPESRRWMNKGKQFLEEEGLYQIYDDGSYIQHSFNYQRVVVQLYTWALAVAKVNSIEFSSRLIERLKTCVNFLKEFIDLENGHVPNWGANDSALFFPLNSADARDFRPQVNALCAQLGEVLPYTSRQSLLEDCSWFTVGYVEVAQSEGGSKDLAAYSSFDKGGYYVIRTNEAATYIRCAKHRHRPFHADNLHVDIWWKHENIIRDAGTYKYNTEPKSSRFFTGCAGHNTVMIDGNDQMQKGKRFIWYNWSQALNATISEECDFICFDGAISAFKQLGDSIIHNRTVKAHRNIPLWIINDIVSGCDGHTYSQNWNISERFFDNGFEIFSQSDGKKIEPVTLDVWFSDRYGEIQGAHQLVFNSMKPVINTYIYHTTAKESMNFNLL